VWAVGCFIAGTGFSITYLAGECGALSPGVLLLRDWPDIRDSAAYPFPTRCRRSSSSSSSPSSSRHDQMIMMLTIILFVIDMTIMIMMLIIMILTIDLTIMITVLIIILFTAEVTMTTKDPPWPMRSHKHDHDHVDASDGVNFDPFLFLRSS
jgi:hypothetical protein